MLAKFNTEYTQKCELTYGFGVYTIIGQTHLVLTQQIFKSPKRPIDGQPWRALKGTHEGQPKDLLKTNSLNSRFKGVNGQRSARPSDKLR